MPIRSSAPTTREPTTSSNSDQKAGRKRTARPEGTAKPRAAAKSKAAPKTKAAPKPKAAAKSKAAPKTKATPKPKAAAKAKATPKTKAAPKPRAATKSKAASEAGVEAREVNLGHLFSLRPRVATSFRQEDFRAARLSLEGESFASITEAARAVAERALELSHEGPPKHGFGRRGR